MKKIGPITVLCAGVLLVSCGGENSPADAGKGTAATTSQEQVELTRPEVEVPKGPPPKRLVVEDIETGSGRKATDGDRVKVHYVLAEYKNGKEVEATWDQGKPFEFELGAGEVIAGWEQGVTGMKVGGRRELVVPSQLAYGSGALFFVIDLLSIDSSPGSKSGKPKPEVEVPGGPLPDELVVRDLEEGSGEEVSAGDEIAVEYVGVNYKTGKEFEAVWGKPRIFPLGTGEVIAGWEQGLKGMKVGGRRELIIPSDLAFEKGAVIYVVDLVDVK